MSSKHVEAWNKLIVKQKFCASSWLITEMYGQQNVKKKFVQYRFIVKQLLLLSRTFVSTYSYITLYMFVQSLVMAH